MTEAAANALAAIAPLLNGLKASQNASVAVDFFSGALWWSDEIPEDPMPFFRIKDWRVLKFVQIYRTGLILGHPNEFYIGNVEDYREIWDEARRLFPDWPGFNPRRSAPELKDLYETLSEPARRELDEIEREMNEASEG